jgi:preprotein translocase subunit SecE
MPCLGVYFLIQFTSEMKSVITFFSEVKSELSKVTWPKRNEVVRLTLIVFAVSGIIGGYVGGLDYLFTKVLATVLTK